MIWMLPLALMTAAPPQVADYLSAPFTERLVAHPTAGRFAWTVAVAGEYRLHVGEAGGRSTQWAAAPDAFGDPFADLQWRPGAGELIYTRQELPDGSLEIPAGRSPLVPPVSRIYLHGEAGSRRLAGGSAPLAKPDGTAVAYLTGGDVRLRSLAKDAADTLLVRTAGSCRNLRWSPDGTQLAFVSDRGSHSFVGVVRPDAPQAGIVWLDPSLDRDDHPEWSPDGTRIAFVRLPASRERFSHVPHRSGPPWRVLACLAEGTRLAAWAAGRGPGDRPDEAIHGAADRAVPGAAVPFFPLRTGDRQLAWTRSGGVVFPYEADGWLRLLHWRPMAFGQPAETFLTPTGAEVESMTTAGDDTLLVVSNRGNLDGRVVDEVAVPLATSRQVSTDGEVAWNPVVSGDRIAYLASDAKRPGHVVTVAEGARTEVDPSYESSTYQPETAVVPQVVELTAADGARVTGQLFLPPDHDPGTRYPALLFTHGGSKRQMLPAWHYMHYYHRCYAFNQFCAARGYVVLSLNYRSGTGEGMEFREAEDYGAAGVSELQDVIGAGLYLRSRPDVAGDAIGLWGGSYGGYLTALALAEASDLFAAGVNIHGVYDWNVHIAMDEPDFRRAEQPQRTAMALRSSPMRDVSKWTSPVLIIHGDADPSVPFFESVHLIEDLRRDAGIEPDVLVLPGEGHDFRRYATWLRVLEATVGFFERELKEEGEER